MTSGIGREEALRLVNTPLDALDGLLDAAGALRDRRDWSADVFRLHCKEALMCLGDRPAAVFQLRELAWSAGRPVAQRSTRYELLRRWDTPRRSTRMVSTSSTPSASARITSWCAPATTATSACG